jgi:hypothetical protein
VTADESPVWVVTDLPTPDPDPATRTAKLSREILYGYDLTGHFVGITREVVTDFADHPDVVRVPPRGLCPSRAHGHPCSLEAGHQLRDGTDHTDGNGVSWGTGDQIWATLTADTSGVFYVPTIKDAHAPKVADLGERIDITKYVTDWNPEQ